MCLIVPSGKGAAQLEKRERPDDPFIVDRQLAYDFKVRRMVFDIQRQHGMEPETKIYLEFGRLNLTQVMTALIEGFRDALVSELAELPPRPLPSGLLPALIEKMTEDRLPSVIAALRTVAQRLHEEDSTSLMCVARFFAQLRRG